MMSARSFVIFPDSTVPTQAASSFSVNSKSFELSSNLALFKQQIFSFVLYIIIIFLKDAFLVTCVQVHVSKQRWRLCCLCWSPHLSGEPCSDELPFHELLQLQSSFHLGRPIQDNTTVVRAQT